jgi:spore coat protein CotH
MDDDLNEHCVLCGENYDSGCFRAAALINESDWTDEIHDVCPESIKTSWNNAIDFVMNSSDDDFKANIENYFDLQSLLDYHIYGMYMCGIDQYGKNQIYMTYDGVKWIASMYDMDSTWGLYWNGQTLLSTDYSREQYEDQIQGRLGNLLYERIE